MEIIFLGNLVLLFVISLPGTVTVTLSTCENPIHIKCQRYTMTFVDLIAANHLSSIILEKCNAQQECHVENPGKVCVNGTYSCSASVAYFGISEKVKLQTSGNLSMFSIMSEGFTKGQAIDFQSITCSLTPNETEEETTPKQMQLVINELAPFELSDKYCIYMENNHEPIQCSGSKELYKTHGPFNSTNGWRWTISFARKVVDGSGIRFWISIIVPLEDYHLKCNSDQGSLEDNIWTKKQTETKIGYYSAAAIGIVVVLNGLVLYICWKKHINLQQVHFDGGNTFGTQSSALVMNGLANRTQYGNRSNQVQFMIAQNSVSPQGSSPCNTVDGYEMCVMNFNTNRSCIKGYGAKIIEAQLSSNPIDKNNSMSASNNTLHSIASWDSLDMQLVENELYQSIDNESYVETENVTEETERYEHVNPVNEENEGYEYVAPVNVR